MGCCGILGLAAYPLGDSELGDLDSRSARHFPVAHADFDGISDANCNSYFDRHPYRERNRNSYGIREPDRQRIRNVHRVDDRNCNRKRDCDTDAVGKPDRERNRNSDHNGFANRQRSANHTALQLQARL